ncbi:TetR family transcriptional regulator [Nonomuraea sp. PA05]|uniref:TetR/AcrR family transcriptional regulator n=1 Tax=Nonomuraea sp. PA05 TaxID=2604466 RepID=UPI0011D98B5F|nr:TetR/AcrR family transcriptional regulator [Nonomuraea sp. PA05]TYB60657.1 TetR family transcriptional regulator [Nonomuraea sp. PA05]
MARWEPNARERLERAALELFVERGYDSTTAAEIAERAGLAKSSFFRHFSDKREVLFGGQDVLNRLFADAIASAPAEATPIEALGAGLEALASVFNTERHGWARQRQAIVVSHDDLRERELLKMAALTASMADALRERGVPDPAASLAAEVGCLALRNAYTRWVDPANDQGFAALARQSLHDLKTATAALT